MEKAPAQPKNTTYADITYNSKNMLRRFSHKRRLKNSVRAIHTDPELRILDFGSGDGMFLNQLEDMNPGKMTLIGYEPYLEAITDNKIKIVAEWNRIENIVEEEGFFDYITCFEVLEHLTVNHQEEVLRQMLSVLSDNGSLIVSVPIEKGLPSVIKNVLRRNKSTNKSFYSYGNILSSFLGRKFADYRNNDGYLEHMGFYYTDLEEIFEKYFIIENKTFSPFKKLGPQFNSQIFYQLKKKRN